MRRFAGLLVVGIPRHMQSLCSGFQGIVVLGALSGTSCAVVPSSDYRDWPHSTATSRFGERVLATLRRPYPLRSAWISNCATGSSSSPAAVAASASLRPRHLSGRGARVVLSNPHEASLPLPRRASRKAPPLTR